MGRCGTRSTYNQGCRCGDCTEANRLYIEQRRRAEGVQPLRRGPQTPHGTAAHYQHGCRCAECRDANRQQRRHYRPHPARPYPPERVAAIAAGRWPQYYADAS